jgi:hypothetical protein
MWNTFNGSILTFPTKEPDIVTPQSKLLIILNWPSFDGSTKVWPYKIKNVLVNTYK